MLISYKNGQTSIVLRVKLLDSSVTTGAGLTGLTSASSGLIISTIADNEASATAYTVAGSTIESITTLGTYAAPTATKCRFKEVDATNHKGVYEIQIADARFAVSSAKSLLVSLSGATNLAQTDFLVQLTSTDPYDATAGGISRLDAAVTSRMATYTQPTGFLAATFPGTVASTTNITAGTITTVTTVTNQLTAAAIATGVWQDTTAGDFTVSASIGKSIMNGVSLGTGLTINGYTGNTVQTGDAYARIGSAGVGLTNLGDTRIANLDAAVSSRGTSTLTQTQVTGGAYSVQSSSCVLGDARIANLDAAVSTRMATYTQPTGFLAATFPSGIIANTTNIAAGTITTVTNLTNAASAGDLTSTMKTSVENAVWDATMASHLTSGTTGKTLSNAGAAGDPWGTALPGSYSAGQAGYIVGNNLDAAVSTRLATSGYTAPPTATQNADALLNRDMSAVSDTNARSPLNALRFLRNLWSISGTTLTVKKEDDTTSAWTASLTTTAGANPVTGSDPS